MLLFIYLSPEKSFLPQEMEGDLFHNFQIKELKNRMKSGVFTTGEGALKSAEFCIIFYYQNIVL